jgi:hypothetical protein
MGEAEMTRRKGPTQGLIVGPYKVTVHIYDNGNYNAVRLSSPTGERKFWLRRGRIEEMTKVQP